MTNTNQTLWNSVSETNPNNTKSVEFGRSFTAIDAYSQIAAATIVFGPVGIGWGWDVEWDDSLSSVIYANLTLWYIHDGKRGEVKVCGGCALNAKPKDSSEARKKALTDSITKALSYIGFNADVFMGKFDDSKYVAERKSAVAKEEKAEQKKVEASLLIGPDEISALAAMIKKVGKTQKETIGKLGYKKLTEVTKVRYPILMQRLTELADQLEAKDGTAKS